MARELKAGHIGMMTNDMEGTVKWYEENLGFQKIGEFAAPDGAVIGFIQNNEIVYELIQPPVPVPEEACSKVDHYCYASDDIEEDYRDCVEKGCRFTTEGIMDAPFWEHGIRFFKIAGPSGEEVEFCQIL
jgi:lactoylglutathione lyase